MPLPSDSEDTPPLNARLLTTVAPVAGIVREASRENLSNLTDGKLAMLKDELVLPVSSSDVPAVEEVTLASAVILTGYLLKNKTRLRICYVARYILWITS